MCFLNEGKKLSHQTLKSFIDLVTFDQRFIELQKKISNIQIDLDKNKQQQVVEQQRLEQVATKKNELQKAIHAQELSLSELQEQEQRLAKNLEALSSPKEYDAALKEMDNLRFSRATLEQKLTQQMNKMQTIEKEYAAAVAQSQELFASLHTAFELGQQQIQSLQQELRAIDEQRSEKIVGIPADWMDMYELMRGRVADPVVPLLQDSCSICFYAVTPRDLQLIRRSAIIQCKDCYRFLYETTVA